MLSQTYVNAILIILAEFLPRMGFVIGTEKLTSLLQATIILISGIWILIRRYRRGDITATGVIK
jgi:hypothetical protein